MTDKELRIKVAKLYGWESFPLSGCPDWWKRGADERINWLYLPKYESDLNAMAKVVETLTDIQFCKYVQTLCGHTTKGVKIRWCGEDAGRAERATARQRAEAFVAVMEGE